MALTQSISEVMSGISKVISSAEGQLFQICGGSSSGMDSGVISLERPEVATRSVRLCVLQEINWTYAAQTRSELDHAAKDQFLLEKSISSAWLSESQHLEQHL